MSDYQNGKNYAIKSRSQENLVYIESTVHRLEKRLEEHVSRTRKSLSSMQIIDIGDANMELVELFPCNSAKELHRREGEIQKATKWGNKRVAGRTLAEYDAEPA